MFQLWICLSESSLSADIAAVAEGQVTYHSSKRLPYGGANLDSYLQSLLDKQGTKCSSTYALQKLKEACTRIPNPDMNAAEVIFEKAVHPLHACLEAAQQVQ